MTVKDDMAMVFVELFQEDRVKSEDHVGLYLFIVPMSLVLACTAREISKDVRGFDGEIAILPSHKAHFKILPPKNNGIPDFTRKI